jgi:hypothetical protein
MNNPIPRCGLFATRTLELIHADIESLPPTQKALVYQYVMATLNSCHELVDDAIKDSKGAW